MKKIGLCANISIETNILKEDAYCFKKTKNQSKEKSAPQRLTEVYLRLPEMDLQKRGREPNGQNEGGEVQKKMGAESQ